MSQFLGRPSDRQALLGNHVPTYNCSIAASKPLIADGGIRYNGDIAKSIRFGATMVMIGSMGSMPANHEESPGNVIKIDGKTYKQYWGSVYRNVEDKQMLVP